MYRTQNICGKKVRDILVYGGIAENEEIGTICSLYIWLHYSIYSKNAIGQNWFQKHSWRKNVWKTTGVTNKIFES